MIKTNGSIETIEGYTTIECRHIYDYVDIIHMPIIIYLDDWDDEEKKYNCESYTINDDMKEWY